MGTGISIHIGLNSVDAAEYGGWSGDLLACEFDAQDMAAIAERNGFTPSVILTRAATSERVLTELRDAARLLTAGDTLLLTYSGHGGQVPDLTGDEDDGADETWVLYDRQVIDDELYVAYGEFAEGVRIAVFSDSCHSGTVTRAPVPLGLAGAPVVAPAPDLVRERLMPPPLARRDFQRRQDTYAAIAAKAGPIEPAAIPASVMLISGCQDNQVSLDGQHNGRFTEQLLSVWNGGAFRSSYEELHRRILQRMPAEQSPRFSVVGRLDRDFVSVGPAFSH